MSVKLPSLPLSMSRREAIGLTAAAIVGLGAGPARAEGTAERRLQALTRGFNLPDWAEDIEGRAPRMEVLEALRELGFRSIRLPLMPDRFSLGSTADQRPAAADLSRLIGEVTALGYSVTLVPFVSSHFGYLLEHAPDEAGDGLASAWATLADVASSFSPDHVLAELLNEPPLAQKAWIGLRDRLAEVVRAKCPEHTILWGAARYQGIWETLDTQPLADANSIAAVHYYTPMGFTHQCESWGGSPLERIRDLPFPATRETPEVASLRAALTEAGDQEALETLQQEFSSPWSEDHIDRDFDDIARWSRQNTCPVVLNEFGVLNFCVDATSRARWTRTVREAAERHGLAWNYWELDQGFGFIADRQSTDGFDTHLIQSLVG